MASTTAINVYSYDRVYRKDFSFYFNKRVFGWSGNSVDCSDSYNTTII